MRAGTAGAAAAFAVAVLARSSADAFSAPTAVPSIAARGALGTRQLDPRWQAYAATKPQLNAVDPSSLSDVAASAVLLAEEKDYGDIIKAVVITLTLGGGLIPALISANSAMFRTLSGNRPEEDDEAAAAAASKDTGNSFDPTIKETALRKYVADSGATGPDLPGSQLLFANERIPLADIVAVLGRIENVDSIADWKNLPSTKMMGVSQSDPPMWLPRKAFKVYIRKARFLGWPTDSKTGQPVGGEELKKAEQARVSKKGALISDAALDAVFDSWAWGASVATPDKVANTLRLVKPAATEVNLDKFVGAAIRGRSTTFFAALTFVVIQIVTFGSLFIGPALRVFFDIDIGFGELGK